jgi:uncharacterized membrane protein YphA (DoxX/SURF4 family)
MSGAGYVAAIVLAGTFALAAGSKLRSPAHTVATLRGLGLPAPATLGRAVPIAELAIAVVLLAAPAAGAVAALVALAFFTTLILSRLRAGATVSCGCFGSTADAPISFVEPLRNALLAALAATALAAPRPELPGLDDVVTVSTAVLVGAIVLALAAVKRDVGAVWATTLVGDPDR